MLSGQMNQAQKGSGWADYNNVGVQAILADAWTQVENTGAGPLTNTSFLPSGVTQLWDTGTNMLDLSGLRVGDIVQFRSDMHVTPTVNNSYFHIRLWFLGDGGWPLDKRNARLDDGAGIIYPLIEDLHFYIGSESMRTSGARVEVHCGCDASILVNGFFISLV